jgi:hypothetical protein
LPLRPYLLIPKGRGLVSQLVSQLVNIVRQVPDFDHFQI